MECNKPDQQPEQQSVHSVLLINQWKIVSYRDQWYILP